MDDRRWQMAAQAQAKLLEEKMEQTSALSVANAELQVNMRFCDVVLLLRDDALSIMRLYVAEEPGCGAWAVRLPGESAARVVADQQCAQVAF